MSHRRRRRKRHGSKAWVFLLICTLLAVIAVVAASLRKNAQEMESRPEEAAPSYEESSREEEPQEISSEAAADSPAEESSEESVEESSEESSVPEPEPEEESDEWKLTLVNRWNPLPADYTIPELTELRNGNAIDSRAYPELQEMFDTMRAQGLVPYITTSYRTHEDQVAMMEYYVQLYLDQEYSENEARAQAESIVAIPGTSEHELGLAVDISTEDHEVQEPSAVWEWLAAHSFEYGFILRYPEDKVEITGIDYEPWHFRYVGKEAAAEIHEQGVCLEEYLGRTEHE